MKNLLSENMLRFGTKNLSEAAKRELVLKSIMETINEHGLHNDVRRVINERQYLMEETGFNPTPYVTAYVNAVKSVMPSYSNAEGEKQTPNGSTIFGQTFYNTPMEISKDRQTILSNISKIQGLVIGKGVPGKELQVTCIPKIRTGNEQFADGNSCFVFQNTNKANFPKYAAMNTAYDNLVRYIQNFKSPTQKQ